MLYSLYEAQHTALVPFRLMAELSRGWFAHPFSPWAHLPVSRRVTATSDLFLRLTGRYEKPAWNIREAAAEVVQEKPFCNLVRFRQSRAKKQRVLVVAPLSGHHATLVRGTVLAMLREHEVWVTDWLDARMVPLSAGRFHLDDYVDYVREWIRLLSPELHVISVCQPTVPVLAAVALQASNNDVTPRTMTMMGGPIDARRSPTEVNSLATRNPLSWFENNVIHSVPMPYPGQGRAVYPGFLQHAGFIAMNPSRHFMSHWDFYANLVKGDLQDAESHRRFYDEYNAVLDMPAEYYLDTIRVVFQEFLLPRGKWKVDGELVNPAAIKKTALLSIEGELDDISGLGQTAAAHDLCTGIPKARHAHITVEGAGHYGIFSGRRWRDKVYPQVRDFIAKYAD